MSSLNVRRAIGAVLHVARRAAPVLQCLPQCSIWHQTPEDFIDTGLAAVWSRPGGGAASTASPHAPTAHPGTRPARPIAAAPLSRSGSHRTAKEAAACHPPSMLPAHHQLTSIASPRPSRNNRQSETPSTCHRRVRRSAQDFLTTPSCIRHIVAAICCKVASLGWCVWCGPSALRLWWGRGRAPFCNHAAGHASGKCGMHRGWEMPWAAMGCHGVQGALRTNASHQQSGPALNNIDVLYARRAEPLASMLTPPPSRRPNRPGDQTCCAVRLTLCLNAAPSLALTQNLRNC